MNQSNPSFRLPPDILVKIFEVHKSEKDLITATHVCKEWRTTLASAPHLWTTEIDFANFDRARFYLARSNPVLVNVTIRQLRCYHTSLDRVLYGDTAWIARVKSLRVHAKKEYIKAVVLRLCQKVPHLQSLTIVENEENYWAADYGGAIRFPPDFLGSHAPSLRTLTFHSVSPSNVFTFPLPKLTRIDWVAKTAHVQIEGLLELFKSSPLLEDIKIHVLVRRIRSTVPLEKVTLNELRRLEWVNYGGVISLIPCLVAPKLSKLMVDVTHNPQSQDLEIELSSLLSPNRDHIPLLLEPTEVTYTCDHRSRSFCCQTSSGTYLKVTERGSFTNSWFSLDLPISFLKTWKLEVKLAGSPSLLPLGDFPIGELENLGELHLRGKVDFLAHLIRGKPVPCIALSKICIYPEDDDKLVLSNLMRVLQGRWEAGHGVKIIEIKPLNRLTGTELNRLEGVCERLCVI